MKLNVVSLVLSLSCASLATLAGCAADTSSEPDDGSGGAGATEDAITGAPSNAGYFVVTHRDQRKCASPMCGGYFVKRVNQATTLCADGSLQAECYVSSIELASVGLSAREEGALRGSVEDGKAVVKATTFKKKLNGATLGTLKATEAWVGATGSAAVGSFYRAADNGIRCIKAPCPSTTAYQLNGHEDHNVVSVTLDHTATPASKDDLDRAQQALASRDGVLVAGGVATPKCLPGSDCGATLGAQEFFLRVVRSEGKSCGGLTIAHASCNAGQFCKWKTADICGAADAAGSCAYKSEICPQVFNPVCGCDGKTYGNECFAGGAGTSVSAVGACKK